MKSKPHSYNDLDLFTAGGGSATGFNLIKLYTMYKLLLYVLLSLLACGCSSGPDISLCQGRPVKSAQSPARVKIFLETSGSMRGFMPPKAGTDFQRDVYNIISAFSDAWPGRLSLFQLTETGRPAVALPLSGFRSQMNSGAFQSSTSTEIPQMLDTILRRRSDREVAVFISDLIFSPESKGNAAPALEQITADIRSRFHDRQAACAIFHFSSYFAGKAAHPVSSPYYFWIMGKPEMVSQVAAVIRQRYPAADQVNFGLQPAGISGSVLPHFHAEGHAVPMLCSRDRRYYCLADYDGEETSFFVGLNLSGLPAYMRDPAFLSANLQVTGEQARIRITAVQPITEATRLSEGDRRLAEQMSATHLVRIRVANVIADDLTIGFRVMNRPAAWAEAVNAPYDDPRRKRTFGFSKLIAGLSQAYNDPAYYTLPFQIILSKNSLD